MMCNKRPKRNLHETGLIESLENRTLLSGVQVVGYLPDYEFSHFSSVDLGALTQLNYFSVVANSSGGLSSTSASGYSFSQLQTVVAAAHAAPSRVSVSITVDPGSSFQAIADSPTATSAFVTNIMAFVQTYHLDGIDMDYEPGTLTSTQMNNYGNLLAALHAQTSANGLILSVAVQAAQMIIPKADISDLDRYLVMDYDLDYNSSAPYSESLSYLQNWVNYGVPKSQLYMGLPFYGRSGTGWNNSATETYAQIMSAYASAHGGSLPAPNVDTVTISGTSWGFNGVTTVQNKANYVLQNGFGGLMMWELGQDYYVSGHTVTGSLLPAIKSTMGAAVETWTGAVSSAWNNTGNWNFGAVPGSTTNVIINSGTVSVSSPFSVTSLVLNGGTLALPSGTSSTNSLSISGNGTLDMGGGTLTIHYGSATDPISAIRTEVASGFAAGAWNGAGIISTSARANPAVYGVGYADSADPGNPAGLPTQTIEIRYTLLGDADLNGIVNGIDFGIVAANFNAGVTSWDQGDFDYNGIVNGIDFGDVSANFNQAVAAPSAVAAPIVAAPASISTTTTNAPNHHASSEQVLLIKRPRNRFR